MADFKTAIAIIVKQREYVEKSINTLTATAEFLSNILPDDVAERLLASTKEVVLFAQEVGLSVEGDSESNDKEDEKEQGKKTKKKGKQKGKQKGKRASSAAEVTEPEPEPEPLTEDEPLGDVQVDEEVEDVISLDETDDPVFFDEGDVIVIE